MIYITTAGGYLASPNSLELYLKELCAMFGIGEMEMHKEDGLDIWGNDVDAILKEAMEKL